jgi:hypothetical protein
MANIWEDGRPVIVVGVVMILVMMADGRFCPVLPEGSDWW